MQPIDAGYLYELGATIRPLRAVGYDITGTWPAWYVLTQGRDAVAIFLSNSIYSSGLRMARQYGDDLIKEINALAARIESEELSREYTLTPTDVARMAAALAKFEPVMIAEMQSASIFYVPPRGAFDNAYLINSGHTLFPDDLVLKVPEALGDIQQSARCIAFDLPTAAGFHLHRTNESVLRRYFDNVAGAEKRPKTLSMGTLLGELKRLKLGHRNIIAALDNIKEFHRNPLMHPEHTLGSVGEAISLYCAVRSAISYMLEHLDPVPFSEPSEANAALGAVSATGAPVDLGQASRAPSVASPV